MGDPTESTPLTGESNKPPPVDLLRRLQGVSAIASHVWGMVALGFTVWFFEQHKGTQKVFNTHYLLMVIGYCIVTMGAHSFKYYTCMSRFMRKAFHVICFSTMIVLGGLGIWFAVRQHNEQLHAHLVSFHSWVGAITVVFFSTQWVFGVFAFALPTNLSAEFKGKAVKVHKYVGRFLYQIICVTMLIGLQEHQPFKDCNYHITKPQLDPWTNMWRIPSDCKTGIVMGFSILSMCVCTIFAIEEFNTERKKE